MVHPVRRLKPTDAEALREVRLRALLSDPGAFLTTWSFDGGADEVRLWVVDDNFAAQRLYRRAGFRTTGVSQPLPYSPKAAKPCCN